MGTLTKQPLKPVITIYKNTGGTYTILNGSSQYYQAAANTLFDVTTQDFSFYGFFYRATDSGLNENLVTKLTGNTGYTVFITTSDTLRANIGAGASQTANTPALAIQPGRWYAWGVAYDRDANSLVLIYDYTTGTLTTNSVSIASQAGTITNTQLFTVGRASSAASGFFPGRFGQTNVLIGTAITQAQFMQFVNTHAISGVTPTAQYLFDGNGNDSISTNNLTAFSTPTYGTDGIDGYYTFNPFIGVTNFAVQTLSISPAYFGVSGKYQLGFTSYDASNASMRLFLDSITEGYEVLIELGKDNASKQKVLRGIIETIDDYEPNKNLMQVTFSGLDWGTDMLSGRIVSLYKEQRRLSDGKNLDPSDTSTNIAKLQALVCGVNQDNPNAADEAYPGDEFNTRFTAVDQGLNVLLTNIDDTGASVPKFEANLERLQEVLNSLDELANTLHYVDPDKNLIVKKAGGVLGSPANVLLTDDANDSDIANYNNYGLIAPGSTYTKTIESHRRRYYGVDSGQGDVDTKQELVASDNVNTSFENIDVNYFAVKFQPNRRKCSAVAVFVTRTDTAPDNDLIIELRETKGLDSTAADAPNGTLITSRQKVAGAIKKTTEVSTDPTSANYLLGWHYFAVNADLNPQNTYWLILIPPNQSSDTTKCYRWYYTAGAGTVAKTSTDGSTWSDSARKFAYRQDYTDDFQLIIPGCTVLATQKHVWEEVVRKPSLTDRTALQKYVREQFEKSSNRREILQCRIFTPDVLLTIGQIVKVNKTQSGQIIQTTGKLLPESNPHFVVTGVEYNFTSSEDEQDGLLYLDLELSRFTPYSYAADTQGT